MINVRQLCPGDKVKDWRVEFVAATSVLKDDAVQKTILPCYVHESLKQLAQSVTSSDNLDAALNELEALVDGVPSRVAAANDFFTAQPSGNLSSFFFTLSNQGILAGIPTDVILLRYFTFVKGGEKIFEDNKNDIKPDMDDKTMRELFKKVKSRIEPISNQTDPIKDEVFYEQDPPEWAEALQSDVRAIQTELRNLTCSKEDNQSEDVFFSSKNDKKKSKSKCKICAKGFHSEKNCFKRKCSNCSGLGHDAEQCPSRKASKPKKTTSDSSNTS